MKIFLASPGIDTGAFSLSLNVINLLFSYYDLSGQGIGITIMRQKAFEKIIKEESYENQNKKG